MDSLYITELTIESVRHLKNIQIPLSKEKIKHLILTGKNGSGKTSVLDAMAQFLNSVSTNANNLTGNINSLKFHNSNLEKMKQWGASESEIFALKDEMELFRKEINKLTQGIMLQFNYDINIIQSLFNKGEFVLAYYKSERIFEAEIPKHVEKIELKNNYSITEKPRQSFVKYLLDLKMTEALAVSGGKKEKAELIKKWFDKFQDLLRRIYNDESLELVFNEDTFQFHIYLDGKDPFDFNTLSSGYAAVLDIVVDIIIRMEKRTNKTFQFDMPGIILIDEIETHLHLDLQKKILNLLTTIFPNLQFVLSTHSPFILNSLENVVIYDLEKNILVENSLSNVPYDGIVEGYFNADSMSDLLKEKYDRYQVLVKKEYLNDEDFEEIAKLQMYLDEIPDYLALGITTEYQRLKLEFESREDV